MKVSEYVSLGHPDKTCDYISERVLDAVIFRNPKARYALEVMAKDNVVTLAGEISSDTSIYDIDEVVRAAVAEIGYTPEYASEWPERSCLNSADLRFTKIISEQSGDIARGLSGWGDQGIFTGMAYNNSFTDYMFPDYYYAKKLCNKIFKSGIGGLDIKTQVYMTDDYSKVCKVVVAVPLLRDEDRDHIVDLVHAVLPGNYDLIVNGTGRYVRHSTFGDCGVTGRKLAVDFYGGGCEVGGGSPWTKDGTKADLSLNLLARKFALDYMKDHALPFVKCKLACVIGKSNVNVSFYDYSGNKICEQELILNPDEVITELGLNKPIFGELCRDGLFSKIK